MKKLLAACMVLLAVQATKAQTTDNLKLIDSTTPFKPINGAITRGTLIKTSNYHFYEINDKVNQKFSNAQPQLMVYQDGRKFKIKIEGVEKLLLPSHPLKSPSILLSITSWILLQVSSFST
ncbi:MAG: hypothetical protein U9R46_13275, partial [Bacteroidota bacterium]|nr:hypothetical protein [Bacteroidota bacterium]